MRRDDWPTSHQGDTRYFNRGTAFHEAKSADFHCQRGKTDEWCELFEVDQSRRVNEGIPDAFWSKFGWSP